MRETEEKYMKNQAFVNGVTNTTPADPRSAAGSSSDRCGLYYTMSADLRQCSITVSPRPVTKIEHRQLL